jgi:hypothetical protein
MGARQDRRTRPIDKFHAKIGGSPRARCRVDFNDLRDFEFTSIVLPSARRSPDSCENPIKRELPKDLKENQPLCEIDLCEMGFI